MKNLVYAVCIIISLPFTSMAWFSASGSDEGFPLLPIACLGLLVFLLINWIFHFNKPISTILLATWKSFYITVIANVAIFLVVVILFFISVMSGMWNR